MVNSILIICEDSPFGKNSVVETLRMATGILAVGDIDDCKVVFMKDAIYFLSQNLDPDALQVDHFTNIMRLIELSDIEIFVHDEALEGAGMNVSDLISGDNIKVVNIEKISQLIVESDMCFKY
ncbi:MAG: DsrE family protein [Candidatus Hodarchaeales archaeon]|jgi:sulfur relay (sulfurtransferase) DsrF/TusC family protein